MKKAYLRSLLCLFFKKRQYLKKDTYFWWTFNLMGREGKEKKASLLTGSSKEFINFSGSVASKRTVRSTVKTPSVQLAHSCKYNHEHKNQRIWLSLVSYLHWNNSIICWVSQMWWKCCDRMSFVYSEKKWSGKQREINYFLINSLWSNLYKIVFKRSLSALPSNPNIHLLLQFRVITGLRPFNTVGNLFTILVRTKLITVITFSKQSFLSKS